MQKALLIDLDGVLRIGDKPAGQITTFLKFIEDNNINACILSNSSLYSSKSIYEFFQSYSIHINLPILTTVDAAYNFIRDNYSKVALYTAEEVKRLFSEYINYTNPEAVLIGDMGNTWSYEIMQEIFNFVQNGAKLIAMHKNKFWNKPETGIQLDAGPFIHAIEFAASVKAEVIGKPSKLYFQSALKLVNLNTDNKFIMLGDDLDSDIKGAKNLGADTILIYTGKTKSPYPSEYKCFIDYEAKDLLDVIKILEKIN